MSTIRVLIDNLQSSENYYIKKEEVREKKEGEFANYVSNIKQLQMKGSRNSNAILFSQIIKNKNY